MIGKYLTDQEVISPLSKSVQFMSRINENVNKISGIYSTHMLGSNHKESSLNTNAMTFIITKII